MRIKSRIQVIELYKNKTGVREIKDWMPVAKWAMAQGVRGRKPPTEAELLAQDLARAAGQWYEKDPLTGGRYRKLLCIPRAGSGTMGLWFDADDNVPRKRIVPIGESLPRGCCRPRKLRVSRWLEHWRRRNPNEEPVTIPTDLTFPVELRRNREEQRRSRPG